MKRNWKQLATRMAYGCFFVLGTLRIAYFLLDFLPTDDAYGAFLGFFVLPLLSLLLPIVALTGIALALILPREWPLLLMAVVAASSELFLSPPAPFFGDVPVPSICSSYWGLGICHSVVSLICGLVFLFFSLRYFLFLEASGAVRRILLVGMATSALWIGAIAALNLGQIRESTAVIGAAGFRPEGQAAAHQLLRLMGLAALLPLGCLAYATIRALAERAMQAQRQSE